MDAAPPAVNVSRRQRMSSKDLIAFSEVRANARVYIFPRLKFYRNFLFSLCRGQAKFNLGLGPKLSSGAFGT